MNELDEVVKLLVKFGDAAIFSDGQIKRANTELAVLRGELTYYRRMFLECKPMNEMKQDALDRVIDWLGDPSEQDFKYAKEELYDMRSALNNFRKYKNE
jgi:hypothetical protein